MSLSVLLLVVASFGAVALIRTIFKNPGLRPFNVWIGPERIEFMQKAFDITEEDCNRLRFDGFEFHHGKNVFYQDYSSANILMERVVNVSTKGIPHAKHWKYERVDGGPDRRYKNNSVTRKSRLNVVEFTGRENFSLHVYVHPYDSNQIFKLEDTLKKFNAFLLGAQHENYEEYFDKYKMSVLKRMELEKMHAENAKKIARCDSVINAHEHLMALEVADDEATQKAAEAYERRENLRRDDQNNFKYIDECKNQEAQVINAVRNKVTAALHKRTMAQSL